MSNLFVLNEIFTNNFNYSFLSIISVFSVISGIAVIISKNPVISVLFLIGLFFCIASYLMMIGITFIGLSYLLVYVGAVSILFLFILMLINVRISELVTENNNSVPLAIMIGIFFVITLYKLLPVNSNNNLKLINSKSVDNSSFFSEMLNNIYSKFDNSNNLSNGFNSNPDLYHVTSHIWDGGLAETSYITTIGNVLYTVYPLWLILTSLILLLAMVGAIVITIKK